MEWLFAHMEDPGLFCFLRLSFFAAQLLNQISTLLSSRLQVVAAVAAVAAVAVVLNQVLNRLPCWRIWASPLSRPGKLFVRPYVNSSRSPLSPFTDRRTRCKHTRATCRTEIRNVPSNGCSRIQTTRARKTKEQERQLRTEKPRRQLSPDLPRCLRGTASGPSSRTKAHPSTLATMSPTSARSKVVVAAAAVATLGSSSTTRRSYGRTRTAFARSSPWRTCMCLRGRGLEKKVCTRSE